ncbi:Protein NUCLEAR FUSION DEFECTIVE 4-like [Quillaja saponaria]|uniref:Protein NUCLEAR FUSION DEFECTIVE 4-like n=1 Tax=Quillaja saponaria TaxID=32244 RepID=A0AAD7LH16_QUISA|nr:Protein NUCLEAR FUSION DEFECTIVE 4-like [Quillaja saponaria]
MALFHEKFKAFLGNRWLVFVCAMWVQCSAGMAYMFGSISPMIKSSMGYNQKQVAMMGVAKDLGDNIGFVAGKLSEVLPIWAVLMVGVVQNFVGYGLVWLIVTHRFPSLPLWVLCICMFLGTNCSPYYNTASLVSCIQSFPESRGPIVGILKGFVGLSGAVLTQIVAMINSPDKASLIFVMAVGPSMVVISLMFIIRPVRDYTQVRPYDSSSFMFVYSICLLLAAYLMGVLLTENLMDLDQNIITLFAIILIVLTLLPIVIPIFLAFFLHPIMPADEEALLLDPPEQEANKPELQDVDARVIENVTPSKLENLLPKSEGPKETVQLHSKRLRESPSRGEDFTIIQALMKADLWLIFFSLVFGAGAGLTIINNMGQICQSLGYNNPNIFVSMISIWNFLGRVGGGYFSEVIIRKFAYPRPAALAVVQILMAIGLFYYVMGWPGKIYIVTVLTALGYGAHWAIVPASASDIFGLKNFGSLYNFLTLGNPSWVFVFLWCYCQ